MGSVNSAGIPVESDMVRIGTIPTQPRLTSYRTARLIQRPGESFGKHGIWFSVLITILSVGAFLLLLILIAGL